MKKVLMIAFHYPPFCGGSGIQRTLKLSRYLPDHGWQPIVLTANARAYPNIEYDSIDAIPNSVTVHRAFALDTGQHLSLFGSYFRWMALPDRWVSWWLGAVPAGLNLVRKHQPEMIWSTYPIATAHLIGLTLHRLTGIPWIADFRDSMTENNYPPDVLTRQSYRWIERQVIRYSSRVVFTTGSTMEMYVDRYADLIRKRCLLIPNGYDEEDFMNLALSKPHRNNDRPLRLIHAGLIYPEERNPKPFFKALSRLKIEGQVTAKTLSVELRASGSEGYYSDIIRELGIADLVRLLPALPYRQALQDCADADGFLLFQAASCNHQIPAKVYEYLRLRKPILALTDEKGDTAALLKQTGGATVVNLADERAILLAMVPFLNSVRDRMHPLPEAKTVETYTRKTQALDLVSCFSRVGNVDKPLDA